MLIRILLLNFKIIVIITLLSFMTAGNRSLDTG